MWLYLIMGLLVGMFFGPALMGLVRGNKAQAG